MKSLINLAIATVLAGAVTIPAAASPIENGAITGVYQARLLGLDIIETGFSLEVNDGQYLVETTTTSDGIVDFFWSYESVSKAQGVIEDGRFIANLFNFNSYYSGKERTSVLEYDSMGDVVTHQVSPDAETDNREPVELSQTKGSADPASVVLNLLTTSQQGIENCTISHRLFDGFRLTRFFGLPTNEQANMPGKQTDFADTRIHMCLVEAELLAGGKLDKKDDKDRKEQPPARLWFAEPAGSGILMPVRMEKKTSWGLIEVQLVKLAANNTGGKDFAWNREWPRQEQEVVTIPD